MSILGIGPVQEAAVGNYTATQAADTGLTPEAGDILYVQVGESNSWGQWMLFDYEQWNAMAGVAAGTVATAANSFLDDALIAQYGIAVFKLTNGNVGVTSRTTNNHIDRVRIATGNAGGGQYKEDSGITHDLG